MRADASEGARHNGWTIDVRGAVGDGVPLIKSCDSGGFGEIKASARFDGWVLTV